MLNLQYTFILLNIIPIFFDILYLNVEIINYLYKHYEKILNLVNKKDCF